MDDKDFQNLSRELQDLGRELQQTTQNVLRSRDASYISNTINHTVWNVVNIVKKGTSQVSVSGRSSEPAETKSQPSAPPRGQTYSYQSAYQPPQQEKNPSSQKLQIPNLFPLIGFTILGFVLALLGLLALLIVALVSPGIGSVVACLIPVIAGILIIASNLKKITQRSRIKKYLRAIGTDSFISIQQLASAASCQETVALKDCRYLCKKFSDLHLDENGTCLILNRETYQFYLEAQNSQRRREEEEERRRKEAEQNPGRAQLYETLKEGNEYLRQIREVNRVLPEEEISRKLSRLELVTEKIFHQVEQNPECLPDIRRFMSYYLPTTLKLIISYQKFETQPVQGANIITAKKEILDALDTAATAFENLLDSLFEDDAMDISTDISAMETILSQEGLLNGRIDDSSTKKQ